jgi:hypothetical protein
MNNFFDMFLRDPVMLAAGAVLAGAAVMLLWALKALNDGSTAPEEVPYEDIPQEQPRSNENSGLTEARLQAIVNQLNDISQTLSAMEKASKSAKSSDQTMPLMLTPAKIEEHFKRLESKIDAMTTVKVGASAPQPQVDLTALETKLEGIHKLLIYLTDSGK